MGFVDGVWTLGRITDETTSETWHKLWNTSMDESSYFMHFYHKPDSHITSDRHEFTNEGNCLETALQHRGLLQLLFLKLRGPPIAPSEGLQIQRRGVTTG